MVNLRTFSILHIIYTTLLIVFSYFFASYNMANAFSTHRQEINIEYDSNLSSINDKLEDISEDIKKITALVNSINNEK